MTARRGRDILFCYSNKCSARLGNLDLVGAPLLVPAPEGHKLLVSRIKQLSIQSVSAADNARRQRETGDLFLRPSTSPASHLGTPLRTGSPPRCWDPGGRQMTSRADRFNDLSVQVGRVTDIEYNASQNSTLRLIETPNLTKHGLCSIFIIVYVHNLCYIVTTFLT